MELSPDGEPNDAQLETVHCQVESCDDHDLERHEGYGNPQHEMH